MIVLAELTESDKGRIVVYKDGVGKPQYGTLTSWNEFFVFARFGMGATSASCNPSDVSFCVPKKETA